MRRLPRLSAAGGGLPRPVLWVMAGLSLCAGVLGFVTGRDVADLSETDVITAYAEVYAQETGGALTDCAAVPGTGAVWLVVRCGTGDARRSYAVGHDGGLITGAGQPPTT